MPGSDETLTPSNISLLFLELIYRLAIVLLALRLFNPAKNGLELFCFVERLDLPPSVVFWRVFLAPKNATLFQAGLVSHGCFGSALPRSLLLRKL